MADVCVQQPVLILDPSDKFRPERPEEEFRVYTEDNAYHDRVLQTYLTMHTNQTYRFARGKLDEWMRLDHGEMTIMDALRSLDVLVDASDPDVNIPNSVHAFQTAERIREAHPDKDWFQLVGLIHDVGKIMAALWEEPQWCVVGDTFPLGCAFSEKCVFGRESFVNNSDFEDPAYNSTLGVYKEFCGLDKVVMSWGHDEYLYQVLKANSNTCHLPKEALSMIRFHSFYPWHTGGAYNHLCSESDMEILEWVRKFNQFDLYSKADAMPDMDALMPYYQSLIDKYVPGKLKW